MIDAASFEDVGCNMTALPAFHLFLFLLFFDDPLQEPPYNAQQLPSKAPLAVSTCGQCVSTNARR